MSATADVRRLRAPTDPADLPRWQDLAGRRLAELLAVSDHAAQPGLVVGDRRPEPGVREASLTVDDSTIPCWFIEPAAERANGAGVVAVAGHGRGIDALIDESDSYHGGLALKLAGAGFTVLCPELRSFGRRRTPEAIDAGPAESSCQVDATRGLLTGRPVLGGRVADALAATRALATVPGIDPTRIAIIGGSGGGAVAMLTAALGPRIAAAVVGTYFSSFAASLCSVPHCICNSVPGLLTWFEMADVAALIAPRPLIIEAGVHDPIFPIGATRIAHDELVLLWQSAAAPPPALIVTDRGHEFVADEAIVRLAAAIGTDNVRP